MSETVDERLRRAAEQGDLEGVEAALAEGADLASADSTFGNTALHLAARRGHFDVVRLLLERGADADLRDGSGNTPLLIACAAGHGRLAADLVRAGAAVEVVNDDGYTPLMGAARSDDKPLAELLLARGADPTHTYVGANTAASLASRGLYGDASLVQLLRRAELLWCLKARRRYLRRFEHAYGSHPGKKRYIFYDGARFVDAWWIPSKQRLHRARGWSESELAAQLAKGHYDGAVVGSFTRGPIGEFSEIPDVVLETAPALAQRFQDAVALLADGTRELGLVRVKIYSLWCREGRWFWGRRELPVPYGRPDDVRLISADFAQELIEETLVKRLDAQPIAVEPARVARANAAIDKALAALQRLYGGEVWEESVGLSGDMLTKEERKLGVPVDGLRLRFARAAKLYLGYQRAGGPLQSVQQDTENSVLADLVYCHTHGSGPRIVPERPDHQLPTTP